MKKPTRKRQHGNPVRDRFRKKRGLATELANHLGVKRTTVWMWVAPATATKVAGRVPAERVIEVGEFLGIARHHIRPDIYPEG